MISAIPSTLFWVKASVFYEREVSNFFYNLCVWENLKNPAQGFAAQVHNAMNYKGTLS